MKALRRWYLTDGKMGEPIEDLDIYHLAIDVFHCNPAELRRWELYDISRIKLVLKAREEADRARVKRQEKDAEKQKQRRK